MLHDVGWKHLTDHRRELRLTLLYKITHDQVAAVPTEALNSAKPFGGNFLLSTSLSI